MPKTKIIKILQQGGVGVLPTDTIYGLVGSALAPKTIKRIYLLKKRKPNKKFIVLVGEINDLKIFKIKLNREQKEFIKQVWPGPVSVILGNRAFRLPKPIWLRKLLKQTGPLVAPSANLEGKQPARTITEAKKYFGQKVDFYKNGGKLAGKPSKLVKFGVDKKPIFIRL